MFKVFFATPQTIDGFTKIEAWERRHLACRLFGVTTPAGKMPALQVSPRVQYRFPLPVLPGDVNP